MAEIIALQNGKWDVPVTKLSRSDFGLSVGAVRRMSTNLRSKNYLGQALFSYGSVFPKRRRLLTSRTTVYKVTSSDDFDFPLDKPIEPPKPKFNREPYVQAAFGAVIALAFAFLVAYGTWKAFDHLSMAPPIHGVPYGLTADVNNLLISLVVGSGGLAAGMFSFTGVGLMLLGFRNLKKSPTSTEESAPGPPPQ